MTDSTLPVRAAATPMPEPVAHAWAALLPALDAAPTLDVATLLDAALTTLLDVEPRYAPPPLVPREPTTTPWRHDAVAVLTHLLDAGAEAAVVDLARYGEVARLVRAALAEATP